MFGCAFRNLLLIFSISLQDDGIDYFLHLKIFRLDIELPFESFLLIYLTLRSIVDLIHVTLIAFIAILLHGCSPFFVSLWKLMRSSVILGGPVADLISHKTIDKLHRWGCCCAPVVFPSAFSGVVNFIPKTPESK